MEQSVTLRAFKPSDTQKVVVVWDKAGLLRPWNDPLKDIQRKLDEMASARASWFWVAECEGLLVGAVMAGYDGHRGSVNYLGVDPDYQKAGIGRLFMRQIEADLLAVGCPKINLLIRSDNLGVHAFYRQLGYQKDATISLSKRLISDE